MARCALVHFAGTLRGEMATLAGWSAPGLRDVLLLEDEPRDHACVIAAFEPVLRVRAVLTLGEALRLLESRAPFATAVVDIGLPDGSGWDFVRVLRKRDVGMPILIYTVTIDAPTGNCAQRFGAECVFKGLIDGTKEGVAFYARRVIARQYVAEEKLRDVAAWYATERRLPPRETQIVALAAAGVRPERMPDAMGVAEGTFRNERRSLLHRCGAASLEEIAGRLALDERMGDTGIGERPRGNA